jgi:hypothetical protein
MAIGTLHSKACGMGFMRKLDVVEGDRPLFDPHMTEGGAGDVRLGLLGLIAFVHDCLGLFGFIVCHVEEFDRVLDIVYSATEQNVAVVMAGLVEKGLGLSKTWRLPLGFFRVVKQLLGVEDSLIGFILHF